MGPFVDARPPRGVHCTTRLAEPAVHACTRSPQAEGDDHRRGTGACSTHSPRSSKAALNGLKGQGKLTEKDIERVAREIRLALLEADVNYKVVKEFVAKVKERALGVEVLESLTPAQQVDQDRQRRADRTSWARPPPSSPSRPRPPTVIMMVGLQGSGKTTACGKLAKFLVAQGKSPAMVAGDVYRPAAVDQLKALGEQLNVPGLRRGHQCRPGGHRQARPGVGAGQSGRDVLIIDTAGRLHIDETLMDELVRIRSQVKPHNILLVLDSMTGQDAVNVAAAVPGEGGSSTGCADQARRRRPRRRGPLGAGGHRQAHQVRQHGREARQLRVLPPRPHGLAHPGHGRRALAIERAETGDGREEGRWSWRRSSASPSSRSRISSTSWSRCARWARCRASWA